MCPVPVHVCTSAPANSYPSPVPVSRFQTSWSTAISFMTWNAWTSVLSARRREAQTTDTRACDPSPAARGLVCLAWPGLACLSVSAEPSNRGASPSPALVVLHRFPPATIARHVPFHHAADLKGDVYAGCRCRFPSVNDRYSIPLRTRKKLPTRSKSSNNPNTKKTIFFSKHVKGKGGQRIGPYVHTRSALTPTKKHTPIK